MIQGLDRARRQSIEQFRTATTVNATVALARLMEKSQAPAGGRKRRDNKARKKAAKEDGAASGGAAKDVTVDDLIQGLDKARRIAIERNRTASIVSATVAMARLLGFLPDTPGRQPSSRSKAGPAPPFKFDGNYRDAARRIALLLELGKKAPEGGSQGTNNETNTETNTETNNDAGKNGGQTRERSS
jgi:hypothetical protein